MTKQFFALIFTVPITLTSCSINNSSSNGNGGGTSAAKPRYVNWETVPSEFNPKIEETRFSIAAAEKVILTTSVIDRDFEVVYSSEVSGNEGILRLFKVYYKSATWGFFEPRAVGKSLEVNHLGMYQCSISVKNGQIEALEGGCYVRAQVVLPIGSQVEVYLDQQLMTKRFIPMSNDEFFDDFESAAFDKNKFSAIDAFIGSYTDGKQPSITSAELGKVVHGFAFKDGKLTALRKLHMYVSNRDGLGIMIESEFGHFNQDEARRIVGI